VLPGARGAASEKFEFVVEVDKSGFLADLLFQLVDGAGGVDRFDAAAVGADEVVAVDAGDEEGEISGPFMKAEAADHAFVAETLEKAEDGGFVALLGEVTAGRELGESHGPVVVGEAGEDGFESLGAAKAGALGFFEEVFVKGHLFRGISGR
jgi:hypothetical protein